MVCLTAFTDVFIIIVCLYCYNLSGQRVRWLSDMLIIKNHSLLTTGAMVGKKNILRDP
ncbi:hypothetical protein BD408DRAFT_416837 [Parasitella parasitica]|nr:hypothetical protein BD408DRAFT_416837 [Parasitella parasitica]